MDQPPPDPTKLLGAWMEWERGETPPGRVMSNLKIAGMRELLEELVAQGTVAAAEPASGRTGGSEGASEGEAPSPESWTPVV
jgi:hypothetical protein